MRSIGVYWVRTASCLAVRPECRCRYDCQSRGKHYRTVLLQSDIGFRGFHAHAVASLCFAFSFPTHRRPGTCTIILRNNPDELGSTGTRLPTSTLPVEAGTVCLLREETLTLRLPHVDFTECCGTASAYCMSFIMTCHERACWWFV